tara:strand:+ start:475 stop:1146 length:672 start_codon:yes stop_codon:yes gene_type:complete
MIRILDIIFSFSAVIILTPLFILIIVILIFTGEGKVFYLQERIGKNKKSFKLYKFVTMLENSVNMGTGDVTVKNDPRILPFGSFLRTSKINELPQLFNILFGDMSVVGFRPQTPKSFDLFSEEGGKIIAINKPGLTGIGSIIFSNEEELLDANSGRGLDFYHKVVIPFKEELEIWWTTKVSVTNYLYTIFLTVVALFFSNKVLKIFLWNDFPKIPEELDNNEG